MRKLFIIISAALFIISCKKTAEEEIASWERNKTQVERQKSTYPNLTKLLENDLITAKAQWEAIDQSLDEEKKAEEMFKVNKTITKTINQISAFKRASEKLEYEIRNFEKTIPIHEISDRIESKLEKAEDKLEQGEERFEEKEFESFNEFKNFVSSYTTVYNEYNSSFSEYVIDYNKRIEKEEAERNKELGNEVSSNNSAKSDKKETSKAKLKCKYCKKTTKATDKKCSGCGAAL